MEIDYSAKFATIFDIDFNEYADIPVTTLSLPARLMNRLRYLRVETVSELLQLTPEDIIKVNGLGVKSIADLERCFLELKEQPTKPAISAVQPKKIIKDILHRNKQAVINGDFSFARNEDLSDAEFATALAAQEAYEILGADLVGECVNNPERISDIKTMLANFCANMERISEIEHLFYHIPQHRHSNAVGGYINAFTQNEEHRRTLIEVYCDPTAELRSINNCDLRDNRVFALVLKFLKWCAFDLPTDVETIFRPIYEKSNMRTVIEMRARKNTLEAVGGKLKVTRERVRQIEAKALRIFARSQGRIKPIAKISAEKNGDAVITPADIERFCGDKSVELIYLLRNYEGGTYTYDRQLDAFIVGDDSLHERVFSYVDSLPEFFPAKKLAELLEIANEEHELPSAMVEKAITDGYRLTGDVYHKSRLSLGNIYTEILRNHYPNGIQAYDPTVIKEFRYYVQSDFGDVKLPENDRALTARIAGICILCGRGVYKLKQKTYMPKSLSQRIYDYIVESENSIFLMNTLFSVFENDLRKHGIDNKYYLQGILHELYGDKLVFSRDYVSKDGGATSIYSSVVEFIKKSKYPVSKKAIEEAYPGISEIVISFSVSDPNILNYFGEYLHGCWIQINPREEQYLRNTLHNVLSDGCSHHVKDVYEVVNREKPEIFTRNAAMYPFSAFSILEYLFREDFQFSRPYIALSGVEIDRPAERLHDWLYSMDTFTFDDIGNFCRENHYMVQSQLEYVNTCNDKYLIVDDKSVMRIDHIGVNADIAKQVEAVVVEEIGDTMPIRQLTCWGNFPPLNVPWTDWLLYSVLNKWSKTVDVAPSNNQFRLSIPLISQIGKMDTTSFVEAYRDADLASPLAVVGADNLDNIDDLLADLLGDELLGDEPWD